MGLDFGNKDATKLKGNDYIDRLETRLRDCINTHKQLLLGHSADEGHSCKLFVAQVAERLLEAEGLEPSSKSFINIVAIDFSRKSIHELLKKCADLDSKSLNGRLEKDHYADGKYSEGGFTMNMHVTMAHYSQLPQKSMRANYEPIVGEQLNVDVTALV